MTSQRQRLQEMSDQDVRNVEPLFGEENKEMHDYIMNTYEYSRWGEWGV